MHLAPELSGRDWFNTGGEPLRLANLRGRVVLLDFWTFCCINCLHVIDELRDLEREFGQALVVIGVHSPKFAHEADSAAVAAAVARYDVRHPVLSDPDLATWRAYGARAWPTLVLIDQRGRVVAQMAGEGHGPALAAMIRELLAEGPTPVAGMATCRARSGDDAGSAANLAVLRFPAKVIKLPSGHPLVADAGQHSLVELLPDGTTPVRRIGTGERGYRDGSDPTLGPAPLFAAPNGLCLLPEELRTRLSYDVVVADTGNHLLRAVALATGEVSTVAGVGNLALSSPWDVTWSPTLGAVVVAMAGSHSLWAFDPVAQSMRLLAGTRNEGLVDGSADQAWLAQPSGLAVAPHADGSERIWFVDSETSALRFLEVSRGRVGSVRTVIGEGLFDFGYRDGPAAQALLQHPLGVAIAPDGAVLIADTYNGAVRRFDPTTGLVATVATGLAEPSGLLVCQPRSTDRRAPVSVLVADSGAHRLARLLLPRETNAVDASGVASAPTPGPSVRVLDYGPGVTARPVEEVSPGPLNIFVKFVPGPGQQIDDRSGPATSLQISATPTELLLEGAGEGTELTRNIVVNPKISEGVLHVSARAATCDSTGDNPACHLAQQDWGIPVKVTVVGTSTLEIPLRG